MPPKLPEHGPTADCCKAEWYYEHRKTQATEFQCWHCKARWIWDMNVHIWKQR